MVNGQYNALTVRRQYNRCSITTGVSQAEDNFSTALKLTKVIEFFSWFMTTVRLVVLERVRAMFKNSVRIRAFLELRSL